MTPTEQELQEAVATYAHAQAALCSRTAPLPTLALSTLGRELARADPPLLPELLERIRADTDTSRTLGTRLQALLDRGSESSHFDRNYVKDDI